ncbi:MAG: methionyl-tRNA formyltransferase [Opitutales bacterium]|nr:methionyl-tRNA formyltransferase [Opitutales bacterium]
MGSDAIALPMLQNLWDHPPLPLDWCGVFTQPDRPTGRGMKLRANAIKQWALEHSIPVRQPERCGEVDCDWLRDQEVDLALVMAYGQILRKQLIATPRLGTLNLHASLLPELRGASPIHTAIATGRKRTGVSLMRIVPKLDAGPVADAEGIDIPEDSQAPDLIQAMSVACVPLMRRSLPKLAAGNLQFIEQDPDQATYCRIIHKNDSALDFERPAIELHNRIRAFQPWPGAALQLPDALLKIGCSRVVDSPTKPLPSGTIYFEDDSPPRIQCGEQSLELLALQRPGGRMLPFEEFLRGFELKGGTVAQSLPMKDLEHR